MAKARTKGKLQTEFEKRFNQHGPEIAEQVKIAQDAVGNPELHARGAAALGKAIAISDATGVPFKSGVIAIGNFLMASENQYVPATYFDKVDPYNTAEAKKVSKLTGVTEDALTEYDSSGFDEDHDEYYDDGDEYYDDEDPDYY